MLVEAGYKEHTSNSRNEKCEKYVNFPCFRGKKEKDSSTILQ